MRVAKGTFFFAAGAGTGSGKKVSIYHYKGKIVLFPARKSRIEFNNFSCELEGKRVLANQIRVLYYPLK